MAVNDHLAHVSDTLFTTGIATYALAMVGYTAEYAFGRRGRVASTSTSAAFAPARVLVGAGGPELDADATPDEATVADIESAISGVDSGLDRGESATSDVDDAAEHIDTTEPPAAAGRRSREALGPRLGRAAVGITIVGLALHLAAIIVRGFAVDSVPWSNMYEFASVVGFIAVVAFLVVMVRAPQIRYLGVFVMLPVVIVMFLAGTVLYSQASPLVPALQSYWLAIHVTAAATAEGILMTSSVLTLFYLIRRRYEVRTAAGQSVRFPISIGPKLPSIATLDKVAYRTAAFAFPISTFGIICGAIWAEAAWGRYWGWDPKETWAFISWVVYAAYLHARATAGIRKWAPWINLLGFAAMTFNFFVVNIVISGLHSYAGLN
ncbi:MAG: c-type cytochrome biogenesis protein CcsB [Actinobacteria bacterium]|nr:c-type cytochrome biogenesis protein CcsB [Actinomycetota bacterium]